MKTKVYSLILSCTLMLIAFNLQAGDSGPKWSPKDAGKKDDVSVIFTGYPFAFITSAMKVGLEFPIQKSKGIQLITAYTGSENPSIYDVNDLSIISIEGQMKFYVNKNDKYSTGNGLYVAPFLMFNAANFKSPDYAHYPAEFVSHSATAIGFGYYFGYQRIFESGFTINMYAGGGLNAPSGDYNDLDAYLPLQKGVRPRAGIALGFAF